MKRTLLIMAIFLSLSSLCFLENAYAPPPPFAQTQPPNGASLSEPPTFGWTPGEYNQFRITMMIPLYGIYWAINGPWIPAPSVGAPLGLGAFYDMSWFPNYGFYWCNITLGQPVYWWVTGLNTRTWKMQRIGPWVFYKVLCTPDCEGKECGPDGCGGSCGECPEGWYCDEYTGQCID